MSETGPRPLRAVPAPPAGIEPGKPVYADVTAPGARRPVIPGWLRSRAQFRDTMRRRAGYAGYLTAFHGLRSPVYAAKALFWGVAGSFWLGLLWLRWWLSPIPASAQVQAAEDGWRAWAQLHRHHRQTTKTRAWISGTVAVLGITAAETAWQDMRWVLIGIGVALFGTAAAVVRPEGVKIVTPAKVPAAYEKLTLDVITRALGSLSLAGIDRWLREGRAIEFTGPVREDGPGYRAELNLPYGVTATQVIDRREQLASGLRRPLGAVWPEPVTTEHTGRLELWVGAQDITTRKWVPWPLLRSGTVDVFKPVPVGTDTRGRKITGPLIYHNWLIGSMPGNGKTAAVRELNAAIALDPLPEMQVHELKGTGDLDAFEPLCTRFVSGVDDESIAYAAESLKRLRAECMKRGPRIKALPAAICPEKKVTRQIAEKYRDLRPLACTIDECQNLFAHPKYGKQAGEDAEFIIKVGRALGIFLILATQRPDKASLPTGVSANVSIRFCLYVAGQLENDMILGTSAYKNGIRATLFRPEVDAGLGYLKGATPVPKVVRTHFLNVPETQAIVARARVARERAGTLPVAATADDPERDVLADVLAVMADDPGLHWEALAERLAARWPDRWAGTTKDAISKQVQDLGVPSATVTAQGERARGCRKSAVEAAMSGPVLPQVSELPATRV